MTDARTMRARILARLPAEEAAWLERRLPAAACTFQDRAAALRAALAMFPSAWPTQRARALERALDGYLSHDFATDRLAGGAPAHDAYRTALYRLALANDGKPLGWRRMHDVATGHVAEN